MTILFSVPVVLLLAALGFRVWRQAVRGGGLPDRMVGLFFLCVGIGAFPALQAPDRSIFAEEISWIPMAIGHGIVSVGFGALLVFAWRCFGPGSAWRRALALGGCGALAILYGLQGLVEGFAAPGGGVLKAASLVRAGALVWAFGESLRYTGLMRRRVALGLADPLVANRFLLWCGWTGGMLGGIAIVISVRFFVPDFGARPDAGLRLLVVVPLLTLATAAALSLWLAFFPPRAYAARVRGTL